MSTALEADELRRAAARLLARADAIEAGKCTGLAASWCPLHGSCICRHPEEALNDPDCRLHSPSSSHAEYPDTTE